MLIATKNELTNRHRLSGTVRLLAILAETGGHFEGVVTVGHVGGVAVVVLGPDEAHKLRKSHEVPGGHCEQRVPKVKSGFLQKQNLEHEKVDKA